MRKLGIIFGFLLLATQSVALAQDSSAFREIFLSYQENGQNLAVLIEPNGQAIVEMPDKSWVDRQLTPTELDQIRSSLTGMYQRSSPWTDLGIPAGKDAFEMTVDAPDGTRWVAKGPASWNRGGPLPAVYHVVKDVQEMVKSAPPTTPAPIVAIPVDPPERLALPPAPELPPGPPAPLALPAPAATAPKWLYFTVEGRMVSIFAPTSSIQVSTRDGLVVNYTDPQAVSEIVNGIMSARLLDLGTKSATVRSSVPLGERLLDGSSVGGFLLQLMSADNKTFSLKGSLDPSTWSSDQLRESLGKVVEGLHEVGLVIEARHRAAVAQADMKVTTEAKGALHGIRGLIESFKAESGRLEQSGRDAWKAISARFDALKTTLENTYDKVKGEISSGDLLRRAGGWLSDMGSLFKNSLDRFRSNGASTDKATAPAENVSSDVRGVRVSGMTELLQSRIQGEVDKADGIDGKDAP
jgi:hypothetical protein